MKKISLVVHPAYQNNRIFLKESSLNRDDCLKFFRDLKSCFADKGYDLCTQDLYPSKLSEFVLYNEMPDDISNIKKNENNAVFLFESELIRPKDWNFERHKVFKKIFTWKDDIVDNKKYFKFNFTHSGQIEFKKYSEKSGFCTLIAGHKRVNHNLELYSERERSIRWFEKNHPENFRFYGVGWDRINFNIKFIGRYLNRLIPLTKALAEPWPLYEGPVKNKLEVLSRYKFSICYENARDITGYITEKIFDSLAAGCVPIYWGAPNISDYVSARCFIDKRDFRNYEDLYKYLQSINEEEYNNYLQNIEKYLKSESHKIFTPQYNAEVVVRTVLNET